MVGCRTNYALTALLHKLKSSQFPRTTLFNRIPFQGLSFKTCLER